MALLGLDVVGDGNHHRGDFLNGEGKRHRVARPLQGAKYAARLSTVHKSIAELQTSWLGFSPFGRQGKGISKATRFIIKNGRAHAAHGGYATHAGTNQPQHRLSSSCAAEITSIPTEHHTATLIIWRQLERHTRTKAGITTAAHAKATMAALTFSVALKVVENIPSSSLLSEPSTTADFFC